MNNKPNIFKPDIGKVDNNEKIFYSFLEDRVGVSIDGALDEAPIDFINRLVKSGSYMFSKNVIIKANGKIYDTKIAGKIGNRIITLDNDSINIEDIEKIYEK